MATYKKTGSYSLILLICMAVMATASAETINENQARAIAAQFMSSHVSNNASIKMAHKAPCLNGAASESKSAYYVFNSSAANGGYVIVAGDDRAPAVLGYSDQGSFDPADVPEAMQDMLESYASQITALTQGAKPALLAASGAAIRPLVTASWSQNSPYNTLLPMLNNGKQAVAGCVATALAQVLYYWKQPARPTSAIPAYTSQSLGIYMPQLEPIEFNWTAMQDTYLSNDTESDGALAAAQLTLYCDQVMKMDFQYGVSGASTNHIPDAISTYFGYKRAAHCEYRENYTTQSWADFIYSELAEGRPVIYSGSKASSGHAFICDGYDGEGLFHINWGWDGMSNGYYLLNVLNPDAQGTGSASESYGYIYGQYVVCNIEPGEGASEFALTSGSVALNGAITSRTSSNANFKATVTGRFYNYTAETIAVNFGWGFYQGDELLSVLYRSGSSALPSGYYFSTNGQELSFGSGITSGTYRIVPIYSEYGANNWRPCVGADVNYIEVTIDGDNCTVTGQGSAGTRDYMINEINHDGSLHHGRPVHLTLNVTNNGTSQNDLLYMHVNGTFNSTAYLGIEPGATDDILFTFLPTTPGSYTCTFSLNEDGSDPIGQAVINVTQMPTANLSITSQVLNVTDYANSIVTDDKYSVKLSITNNGTEDYQEDITVKLYKNLDGTYGSNAQIENQFVHLGPGETAELQFDLDNVINGWRYFAAIYYYSDGQAVLDSTTPNYTVVFPTEPDIICGDVNGDNQVNIADVTALIDHLLNSEAEILESNADVNPDGNINIADVTALIDMLLSSGPKN